MIQTRLFTLVRYCSFITCVILLCSCGSSSQYDWETKEGKYNGAYEGGWWSGKTANGYGVWTQANGTVTSGVWINGNYGSGNYTREFPNGDKFVGLINSDGSRKSGVYNYKNGDRYEGSFNDNQLSGYGTLTKVNGEKYVGNFSSGKYSGSGNLTKASGTRYVGNFSDGMFSGKGFLTERNWTYDGNFSNDMMNGQGTLTSQGSKFIGEFKNNHLYYVSHYTPNGTLSSKGIWKANSDSWERDTLIKTQAQMDQEAREEAKRKEIEDREQKDRANKYWEQVKKAARCEEFNRARKDCRTAGDYSKCMQISYSRDYTFLSGWAMEKDCGL